MELLRGHVKLRTMYSAPHNTLELDDIARILEDVNPYLDGENFDPIETSIKSFTPAFYPGYNVLDIQDNSFNPPVNRSVLYKGDQVIVLNWSNEPIYKLNAQLPIELDENTISDYVSFFFAYVRGQKGQFLIVENVDDIPWKEDPPPNARKAISNMIKPLSVQSAGIQGSYKVTGCMMFKNSLFQSDVIVTSNGMVSMENEELLVEDIPVLDDIFKQ